MGRYDPFLSTLKQTPLSDHPYGKDQLSLVEPVPAIKEIKRFKSAVENEEILWNTSELNHFILRTPTIEEIEQIVVKEEERALKDHWECLVCTPHPRVFALRGIECYLVSIPWLLRELRADCGPVSNKYTSLQIEIMEAFKHEDLAEQQDFLRARTPKTVEQIKSQMTATGWSHVHNTFVLKPSETGISDPVEWLERFCGLLLTPPPNRSRSYLFAVAYQLRKSGIFLLSQCAVSTWRRCKFRNGTPWGHHARILYGHSPYSIYLNTIFRDKENELLKQAEEVYGSKLTGDRREHFLARMADILWCSTLDDPLRHVTWSFVEEMGTPAGHRNTFSVPFRALLKAAAQRNAHVAELVTPESNFMSIVWSGAAGKEEELSEWLQWIESYSTVLGQKKTAHISAPLRIFLSWLGTVDPIPSISQFTRKHVRNDLVMKANTFREFLQAYDCITKYKNTALSACEQFFDWLQTEHPHFRNPVVIKLDKFQEHIGARSASKTHRKRIPSRILDDMRNFLIVRSERGFEWSPWVKENCHFTFGAAKIFCPVYPGVIAMLLRWPLRSNQVLWLDSGELDEKCFDFSARAFVDNPAGLSGHNQGVLTPAIDIGALGDNHYVDLQVIINKRIVGDKADYTIPFVDDETMWIIEQVLLFQREYGAKPRQVKECDAPDSKNFNQSNEVKEKLPNICCLFRHPNCQSLFPPNNWEVNKFWAKVCLAYDEQNEKWVDPVSGQVGPRPNWPKMSRLVVKEYNTKMPTRVPGVFTHGKITKRTVMAIFDIHSLRVGGISYLLDRGVSLAVVASIAGHASLVMTLHYYVLERHEIHKQLSQVLRENPDMAQTAKVVEERLKSATDPRAWLNALSDSAFSALHDAIKDGGHYRITGRGICPGTRCDDGLQIRLRDDVGKASIVPGSLCGLCKFNLYGLPFLPGLVREFNETLYALERTAKKQINIRVKERECEASGGFDQAAMLRSEDEQLVRSAEPYCAHLVRLYEMIQELLANPQHDGNKYALMSLKDVRCSVNLATSFEQMREILEVSELLPATQSQVPDQVSVAFQNKLMGLLVKNGVTPYLAGLPEPLARKASLELADLLTRSIPSRSDLEAVFQGRKLLKDVGSSALEDVGKLATKLLPSGGFYVQ